MVGGTGPEPLLSPPPLGRFLSNGSSSGGESSSGDAVDERSGPPIAGPSRITAGGAKGGTPPLDLYRLMRRLSTSSSSSSASSSFGSARRSASASEGDSEATGSSEGSFVWLAVLRAKLEHVEDMACFLKGVSSRVLDNEPDVLSHRILRGVDDEDEILGCKFVVYAEFRNDDAFDSHIQSEEFQLLVNNAKLLAGAPQLYSYRDITTGDNEGSDY